MLTVPALTQRPARRRDAAREFNDYLIGVIAERRACPEDDLISALIAARDGDAALTEAELLNGIALLLIAGHETTVNLIGNGVLALLQAPDQLELLCARPELLPSAIEELLRYDGPVERASHRIALEDMEIAGTSVPRGAWVHVSLGAADRDAAAFDDPDRLDVTRAPKRHVAFGHGPHFCLGAPLARLEGEIAIGGLLDRSRPRPRRPGHRVAPPPHRLHRPRPGPPPGARLNPAHHQAKAAQVRNGAIGIETRP